jgi:autotransporter-associated beta strand protein
MVLSGGNTYSGGTNVSAGTLRISAADRLTNAGALTVSGGTFDLQTFNETVGTVTLTSGSITGSGSATLTGSSYTVESGTASAILGGTGALTKNTSGTVTLSGANTYTGGSTVNGGTVVINSAASLGATSGGVTINAGTVEVATGFSSSRAFTLGNAASTIQVDPSQTFTLTSAIGGSGALNKTGSGTMVVSGANTYSGGTNVAAGTLQISASDRLVNTGALTVSGGTFDVQTFTETVGTVSLTSGTISGSGTGTLTGSSYAVQSGTASAILGGTGTMTKTTSGNVTLTGTNTFTGATTISGGKLIAAGASGSALGSTTAITVNSGGTLSLGANDQLNNSATVTMAGGTFEKGNFSEGLTTLQGMGALTLTASGSHIDFGTGTVGILSFASLNASTFDLTIDNWTGNYNTVGSGSTDRLIFDADQTTNLDNFFFTGYGAGGVQFNLGGGYWEVVAAVPEPSTWLGGALAFVVLGAWHARRWPAKRVPRSAIKIS